MRKISLDQLATLFVIGRLHLILIPEAGEGSLYVFDIEKGLQLRFWDCRFSNGLEVNTGSNKADGRSHLVFFLHAPGLNLVTDRTIQKNSIWDTVFFSSASNFKMTIPASVTVQCLSMSFSKEWLSQNLSKGDRDVRTVLKKLIADPAFCKLECMNVVEKKNVLELSAMAISEDIASFYFKSNVLKIIGDFFFKLVEDKFLDFPVVSEHSPLDEIEKYLSDNPTSFKTTEDLANRFSMSESSLKKLFKRRYGTSIPTFIINKRMELAKRYVQEEEKTLNEAARMVGYKNVRHFIARYKKHFKVDE